MFLSESERKLESLSCEEASFGTGVLLKNRPLDRCPVQNAPGVASFSVGSGSVDSGQRTVDRG